MESFHSVGRSPVCSDLLNKSVSDGVMLQAHSFNKQIGILSGPEALLGFRLLRTIRTSHGSRVISEMVSLDKGDTGRYISSVSFKNTELK